MDLAADEPRRRRARARSYLMCPPEHFAVTYAINPWMRPDRPTDAALAMRQWARLRQVYLDLGHDVRTIEPVAGLPDMVFAANGATVVDGTVLGVRFAHPRAGRGSRRVPGVVPRARLRGRARGRGSQRGRGRHPVHRAGPAGRVRVPQRPGGRGRAGRGVRAAGGEPAPGRPALLPPGHGAVRARRRHRHVLPGRVRRRRAGRDRGAVRRADRGEGRGRRGARAERGQRRPARRPAGPGPQPRRPAPRARASSRSGSTCPSCSRAAADPSAARWSCAADLYLPPKEGTSDDRDDDRRRDRADAGSAGSTPRTTTIRCRS